MRVFAQPGLQSFVRVVLSAALLSLPLSVSHAQSQPPSQSGGSPNIPEEKLDAAAAALLHVTSVQQSYQQRMAESATSSAKAGLANEADEAVAKAITDEGLSVREYASIMEVARNDPAVREKIQRRMDPATK